jgi:hypothetical protein
LFISQLWMYEDEIKIQERGELERYMATKAFMMQHGANIIDMYQCLDDSGQMGGRGDLGWDGVG